MRQTSVEKCIEVFDRNGLDIAGERAIEVAGTSIVWLEGGPKKNPMLDLAPGLTLLDGGFTVEALEDAEAHIIADFLDCDVVKPLTGQYDRVFSFDTLEHIREPFRFARHLARVACAGGVVFVSTVFQWSYHPSPDDYWRFTPEGLRQLFTFEGFGVIGAGWERGSLGVWLLGRVSMVPQSCAAHCGQG
jgi:hypothetical protein